MTDFSEKDLQQGQIERFFRRHLGKATPKQAKIVVGVINIGADQEYILVRTLGGRTGQVFEALDKATQEVCAIKLFPLNSRKDRLAFSRIREVSVKLQHPCIVHVKEVAVTEDGSTGILITDFLEGKPLQDLVLSGFNNLQNLFRGIWQISDALGHLHQQELIYRDLKPHNIILSENGRVTLLDLDLIAPLDPPSEMEAREGTPEYAAPELLNPNPVMLHPNQDVYSFGKVLYELIVGPVFSRMPLEKVREIFAREMFPIPRKNLSFEERELLRIALKSLSNRPERRYQSGDEIKDELLRLKQGHPIQAPFLPTRAERIFKRASDHWRIVLAVTASILLFSAMAFQQAKLEMSRRQEARQAEIAEREAEIHRYHTLLTDAEAEMTRRQPGWTWRALSRIDAAMDLGIRREEDSAHLRSMVLTAVTSIDVKEEPDLRLPMHARCVALSPEGRFLAAGGKSVAHLANPIQILDLETGQRFAVFTPWQDVTRESLQSTIELRGDGVRSLVFVQLGPGRQLLAAGTRFGLIAVGELKRSENGLFWDFAWRRAWRAHDGEVQDLAFLPDGLVSVGHDHRGRMWNLEGEGDDPIIREEIEGVEAVAEFLDSERNPTFPQHGLHGDDHQIHSIAIQESGPLAASGGGDGRVHLWHVGSMHRLYSLPGQAEHIGVAIGEERLAIAHDDAVGVYRLRVPESARSLPVTPGDLLAMAPSPEGTWVACLSRRWDERCELSLIGGDEEPQVLAEDLDCMPEETAIAWDPRGRKIAVRTTSDRVLLFDTLEKDSVEEISFPGQEIAFRGKDGLVTIRRMERPVLNLNCKWIDRDAALRTLAALLHPEKQLFFSLAAFALKEQSDREHATTAISRAAWSIVERKRNGEEKITGWWSSLLEKSMTGRARIHSLAADPVSGRVVWGTEGGSVKMHIPQEGSLEHLFAGQGIVSAVAISPVAEIIAAGNHRGQVVVHHRAVGARQQFSVPVQEAIRSISFSPNGDLLAVAAGKEMSFWSLEKDGVELLLSLPYSDEIESVHFSNERIYVHMSKNRSVLVYDLTHLNDHLGIHGIPGIQR
jgi:WD40 repeat protein